MILTTEEYRSLADTALEEDALALLLDATETDIVRAAGPSGERVETFAGGGQLGRIILRGTAESIVSITETSTTTATTLDPSDYALDPDGYTLYRLTGGTNSRRYWYGRVAVTYVPLDDEALRKGVQADLVKLALTYVPGVTMVQVGSWTEQLASNLAWNRDTERATILGRLSAGPSMAIVGEV